MQGKYKIGTISKLLGIPVQTLHYYEKCGLVTPIKDKDSNYRYYDAWDINFLLDCKYWHSFQFSNSEIEELLNKDNTAELLQKVELQERKLMTLVCHYQGLLDKLNEEKKRIVNFKNQIGDFQLTKSPALLYNSYRSNNTYCSSNNHTELPNIEHWISTFPFVQATFTIPLDSIVRGNPESTEYWWGFSISPRKAKEIDLPEQCDAKYISSKTCMYTVFQASNKGTFAPSLYEHVFTPIWKKGYEIIDMPIGRLIVRAHEDQKYSRYFEIWVPVE